MQALLSTCTTWRSRSSARPATATATATEAEAATQTRPSQALPLPLPLPRWRSLQAAAACSLLLLYKPRESGQATRILPHSLSLPPTHTHTTNPLSNCACLCRRHTLSAACPLSRCFLCWCCCCWRHCSIELDSARDAGSGRGRGEADRQQTVTRLVG